MSSHTSTTTRPRGQALLGSREGGMRMVARLWLARVFIVFASGFKDLFIIFITFEFSRTVVEYYE
jgi:hypothetical protein